MKATRSTTRLPSRAATRSTTRASSSQAHHDKKKKEKGNPWKRKSRSRRIQKGGVFVNHGLRKIKLESDVLASLKVETDLVEEAESNNAASVASADGDDFTEESIVIKEEIQLLELDDDVDEIQEGSQGPGGEGQVEGQVEGQSPGEGQVESQDLEEGQVEGQCPAVGQDQEEEERQGQVKDQENGRDQGPSCSCREEIDSFKDILKQMTLEIEKTKEEMTMENRAIKMEVTKQKEIMAGMKSGIRNAVMSLLTCCKDDEKDEVLQDGSQGVQESSVIVCTSSNTSGIVAEDAIQLENQDNVACVQIPSASVPKLADISQMMEQNAEMANEKDANADESHDKDVDMRNDDRTDLENDMDGVMGDDKGAAQNDDDNGTPCTPDDSKSVADKDGADGHDILECPIIIIGTTVKTSEPLAELPVRFQNDQSIPSTHQAPSHQGNSHDLMIRRCSVQIQRLSNQKTTEASQRMEVDANMGDKEVADETKADNKQPYKCHLCNKPFKSQCSIFQHIQSVHRDVSHKCAHCPAEFTALNTLERHEEKIHTEGGPATLKCNICGVHLLKAKNCLEVHMGRINENSVAKLEVQLTTPTLGAKADVDGGGKRVVEMKKDHQKDVDFSNRDIGHVPDVTGDHHENKISKERSIEKESPPLYKCHLCKRGFYSQSGVDQHIRTTHEGVRYKCTHCPAKLTTRYSTRKHEAVFHKKGQRKTNDVINSSVHGNGVSKSGKDMKEDNHYGNKIAERRSNVELNESFKCSKCEKSYKSRNALVAHTRCSHGPPRKCNFCTEVFSTYSSFRDHRSGHDGVCYKCEHCPAQFTKFSSLQKHERMVHKEAGPPTQKCELCGVYLLDSKISLHNHRKQKHKKLVFGQCSKFLKKRGRLTKSSQLTQLPKKKGRPAIQTKRLFFQCYLCPNFFSERKDLYCHRSQAHGITVVEAEPEK